MKQLVISDDISLPFKGVTEKFAWLGRTGSGKTYGASKLAEEMLFAGAQIVVIDPMGVWYGLRLSADGKHPSGLEIPVFGGLHGDLPLTPESGALIADLIVERRISAILDVSQMIDSEINKFCTAFGDRFFQRMKGSPAPVHLFLEECQEFLPQNIMKGEERKLHVFQRIAKQGRNFGIGVSLISQRPQEINKKALNMSEVMLAFQMTGPQERKAIELWISDKGLGSDIVAELPKFKVGHPHIWSPQWLEISQNITIAKKKTYDASATPEFGKAVVERRELTPVDVAALKESMSALIEQAEADDPAKLKAEIVRLKRELASKPAPVQSQKEIVRVEMPVFKDGDIRLLQESSDTTHLAVSQLIDIANKIGASLADAKRMQSQPAMLRPAPQAAALKPTSFSTLKDQPSFTADFPVNSQRKLQRAEHRILTVLAQYPQGRTKTQLAVITGYAKSGGGFTNAISALRSKGLIDGDNKEQLTINQEGVSALGNSWKPLPVGQELYEYWIRQLSKAERSILGVLFNEYPNTLTKEVVASMSGYEVSGGGFINALGHLRTLELITGKTELKASGDLFG